MAGDDQTHAERSIRARQTIRVVVWVVALAALVIFAAVNTQDVAVDWLFDESEMQLWVVIAGSAVVGALIGYVTRWRRS